MKRAAILLTTGVLIANAPPVGAQDGGVASMSVRVTDIDTGESLPGAHVTILDLYLFWIADANGSVRIAELPAGEHGLEVSMVGYAPERATVELGPGAAVEADVALTVQPVELPGVTATVEPSRMRWSATLDRSGFYRRSRRGLGHQFDRLAIEERNALFPSDIFRGLPGVQLVPTRGGGYQLVSRRSFGSGFNQPFGGCPVEIYLDGLLWDAPINDVPIDWIEGVEFFSGPSQAPIEYTRSGESCGVVLIWTR